MPPTQDDIDRWAKLIATAYASEGVPLMTPIDVLNLAAYLGGPLADCIMLAIPPKNQGPDFINPALDRREAAARRRRGRRLARSTMARAGSRWTEGGLDRTLFRSCRLAPFDVTILLRRAIGDLFIGPYRVA